MQNPVNITPDTLRILTFSDSRISDWANFAPTWPTAYRTFFLNFFFRSLVPN